MEKYFAGDDAVLELRFTTPCGGRVKTDCKVSFAIYDKNTGNPAIVSPAEVVGKVEDGGPARVMTQTRGAANKYSIHFKPSTPGEYSVSAEVRGKFSGRAQCRISDGLSSLKGPSTNGQIYSFTTQCADKNGTPLSIDLGDQLAAGLEGPEGSFSDITSVSNGNGSFKTSVKILQSGQQFSLTVQVNGQDVGGSPLKFSS